RAAAARPSPSPLYLSTAPPPPRSPPFPYTTLFRSGILADDGILADLRAGLDLRLVVDPCALADGDLLADLDALAEDRAPGELRPVADDGVASEGGPGFDGHPVADLSAGVERDAVSDRHILADRDTVEDDVVADRRVLADGRVDHRGVGSDGRAVGDDGVLDDGVAALCEVHGDIGLGARHGGPLAGVARLADLALALVRDCHDGPPGGVLAVTSGSGRRGRGAAEESQGVSPSTSVGRRPGSASTRWLRPLERTVTSFSRYRAPPTANSSPGPTDPMIRVSEAHGWRVPIPGRSARQCMMLTRSPTRRLSHSM